jgi:hypothetical protein
MHADDPVRQFRLNQHALQSPTERKDPVRAPTVATCGPVTKQWPTAMVEILMMRQAGVARQSRRVRAPRTLGDAKPRWTPHTIGERDTLVCPRRLGHPEVQPARLHTEWVTARGSRSETSPPPHPGVKFLDPGDGASGAPPIMDRGSVRLCVGRVGQGPDTVVKRWEAKGPRALQVVIWGPCSLCWRGADSCILVILHDSCHAVRAVGWHRGIGSSFAPSDNNTKAALYGGPDLPGGRTRVFRNITKRTVALWCAVRRRSGLAGRTRDQEHRHPIMSGFTGGGGRPPMKDPFGLPTDEEDAYQDDGEFDLSQLEPKMRSIAIAPPAMPQLGPRMLHQPQQCYQPLAPTLHAKPSVPQPDSKPVTNVQPVASTASAAVSLTTAQGGVVEGVAKTEELEPPALPFDCSIFPLELCHFYTSKSPKVGLERDCVGHAQGHGVSQSVGSEVPGVVGLESHTLFFFTCL